MRGSGELREVTEYLAPHPVRCVIAAVPTTAWRSHSPRGGRVHILLGELCVFFADADEYEPNNPERYPGVKQQPRGENVHPAADSDQQTDTAPELSRGRDQVREQREPPL